MSKKGPKSYFAIGLFFLSGIVLLIAIIIWLGAAHFFEQARTYETFFNESVGGLNSGSDVKFFGVTVGRISEVKLMPGRELVRVTLKLDDTFKVKKGMAAELEFKGITGGQSLSIVQTEPGAELFTPPQGVKTTYAVIPSVKSQTQRVEEGLKEVYKKIKSINVDKLAASLQKTAADTDKVINSKQIQETLNNIAESSRDVRKLLSTLDQSGTPQKLAKTIDNLSAAAEAARKASETVAKQLEGMPPHVVGHIAENVDKAAKTGERSLDTIQKHLDQSMALLQQSLSQMNQLLDQMKELVNSLRESPGRILTQPQGGEPFKR